MILLIFYYEHVAKCKTVYSPRRTADGTKTSTSRRAVATGKINWKKINIADEKMKRKTVGTTMTRIN